MTLKEKTDIVKEFICKTCGKKVSNKDLTRQINYSVYLKDRCAKCEMERNSDLDRTGRSSKKDKFKSKSERDLHY